MKITATQKEFLKRMSWIVGVMGAYDPARQTRDIHLTA